MTDYAPHNPDNCECEHESHVDKCLCDDSTHIHYPKGDKHSYNTVLGTKLVLTQYGVFNICKECLDAGHLTPYIIKVLSK